MNVKLTMAAEGLPRRAFSVADVERMVEAGIIGFKERVELIGGDLVPMAPKSDRNETVKIPLNMWLCRNVDDDLCVASHTTFRLSPYTYLEPDFVLFPLAIGISQLNGINADLVIEIADESLDFDLGRKAALYAEFKIRELWVIDAKSRCTYMHREPRPSGYGTLVSVPETDFLEAAFVPGLALSLSTLDRPE